MSQTVEPGIDNIMHCAPQSSQSKATQNSVACLEFGFGTETSRSLHNSSDSSEDSNMPPHANYSYPITSGSSTPVSTRSSISYESNASSNSSSMSRPRRSSMKPSLRSSQSSGGNLNRRSSPPTVRFADTEPASKPPTKSQTWPPTQQQQRPESSANTVPNPLLQLQHHHPASFSNSSSNSMRYTRQFQTYTAPPPPNRDPPSIPIPQPGTLNNMKRIRAHTSTPARSPPVSDRWSNVPLPARFSTPAQGTGSRVLSYQSTISNVSTQSAPPVLSTPSNTSTPPGQYNPLQNYIPCLDATCLANYTPTHTGPTYYLPQGPYSLTRLHGYCSKHAAKDLKDANAACKKEWESLRQNAGRKTLGFIAAEFEIFLEQFREDRRDVDARLRQTQKLRVLGTGSSAAATRNGKAKQDNSNEWEWRYTPRHCTKNGCKSNRYSPFANHLYNFYNTRRPSTFFPLQTLCPSCSNAEVEAFEKLIQEKWSSRCGWDEAEWDEWFSNAVRDREMEQDFWEKAQERVVKEKGPARLIPNLEAQTESAVESDVGRKARKSIFKRLFASMAN